MLFVREGTLQFERTKVGVFASRVHPLSIVKMEQIHQDNLGFQEQYTEHVFAVRTDLNMGLGAVCSPL